MSVMQNLNIRRKRLNALEEEWGAVYQSFPALIEFLKQQQSTFTLSEVAIHPALREAMNRLYGYTSDEGGIRHAMLEQSNIDEAELSS